MTIAQAVISGIVQGATEFFPISSSGHLVILHAIFGIKEPQMAFDIFLHFGTLLAVLIFFRNDILKLFTSGKRTLLFIVVGSIPTFALGMLFKDVVESFFAKPGIVGFMLLLTGFWLLAAGLYTIYLKRSGLKRPQNIWNSLVIGLAQGISIMPGISRSGATIATGMLLGLDKETAFRFSFLLSIPAIFGATALKASRIGSILAGNDALYFIIGGVTALGVGLVCIKALLELIRRDLFFIFGIYCFLAGSAVLIMRLR
ncbi:MAG: undecaprenyl-diphosphate phosphatase [Candidatus Omnitrophica bacterium]|nr:undecaprenyl-diphosphate phosphatase [Candidatus Omnitrophota bacterium]